MHNSIQVTIACPDAETRELLIAQLSDMGYEGFEESETVLLAYADESSFDEEALTELLTGYSLTFEKATIPPQNWNEVWESSFHPVVVDGFVAVRAEFHEPIAGVEHEIIITPKMSFGTGHHATTWMMMQQMHDLDFTGKDVFDFGTGTGILAILAQKLGAASVTAIDNDEWSITNATENFSRNSCDSIVLYHADAPPENQQFHIILANINRNILLQHLPQLAALLTPGGSLLLSGLLAEDEPAILLKINEIALKFSLIKSRDKWISMLFTR